MVVLKTKIKDLNIEIKNFFTSQKRLAVRRGITPGNTLSLWSAVKIAKDINVTGLPGVMYLNNIKIPNIILAQKFADFFENKVKTIISEVEISNDVYNGKQKMFSQNAMFMTTENIIKCFDSIKNKNSEGFDRIPQRILVDGLEHLLDPLTKLFKLIYNFKQIPQQWLVSKITPIHKIKNHSLLPLFLYKMHCV